MALTRTDAAPPPDPYEPRPTIWDRRPQLGWVLSVSGLTAFLLYAAFPPLNIGEAGYVLALAAALWTYRKPSFKLYAATVLGAQAVGWTLLLGWLHHVTWAGLFLLGPFIGLLTGVWYLAVWWVVPRLQGHQSTLRIFGFIGLAALWVLLEWLRSWFLSGFPWLPLAASQWERPLVLQVAAYAGSGAVSFVLIMFNLGAAAYAHRIFFEGATGLKKRSPEFMAALLILAGSSFPLVADAMGQQRQTLARVAIVQPYIPQNEKWDEAHARDILRTLEMLTVNAARIGSPDFIAWPEAVTPWALGGDANVQAWLESLVKRAGKPILLGVVRTEEQGAAGELWHNSAVVVDPSTGLQPAPYNKRKLVPFGEYVPLRPVLGWLQKFVPIGGDFLPGASAEPLSPVNGGPRVGVLICYEDIFPYLARQNVQAGADMLAVLTNNAWYGEGGAAYQHAAHSVLRAIETRRPVLRCGNGGWSGWIDEFGQIRDTVTNDDGSIYFRGYRTLTVTRDLRWQGRESPYVQRGDWFIALCAALSLGAYWLVLTLRPPPPRADGEPVF